MNTRITVFSVLALCAAGLLAGCNKSKKEEGKGKDAPADTVTVKVVAAPVQPRRFDDWGNYSADLRGARDAMLTGAGGRVSQIAEVGKNVHAGQALCDIESSKYNAMLLQAKAALDLAKNEMDRQKVNVEKGYVGKAALDKSELDFQSARVAFLQARRAYEDSRCQAPFAGVLVSRYVDQFQTAVPGAPTVRVAVISRLEAVVAIPENEAEGYRDGQTAEFTLVQDPSRVFSGKLKSVDRAIEAHNRTVKARIEIPNSGGALRPGMVGKVRILRKKYTAAVVVPSQAVLRLQDGTMAMVVRDGKAEQVPVRLGPSSGDSVVVESGLSSGDVLITVGAFEVSTGTKVSY